MTYDKVYSQRIWAICMSRGQTDQPLTGLFPLLRVKASNPILCPAPIDLQAL